MNTEKIFELFGGPTAVGRAIGVTRTHAGVMRMRGSIPSEYWAALVEAARKAGFKEITPDALVEMTRRRSNGGA
jgi:hypothetical protein